MSSITSQEALNYLDRWKSVRDREVVEWRKSSMETRLRQISALISSRDLFAEDASRQVRNAEVSERWARIREAANG